MSLDLTCKCLSISVKEALMGHLNLMNDLILHIDTPSISE